MSNQLTINVSPDPEVIDQFERMKELVPDANESHVVRAAVRYLAENSAEYEQEVYIREQIDFEAHGAPGSDKGGESTSVTKSAYSEQEWVQLADALILAPANMTLNLGRRSKLKTIREFAALTSGAKKLSKSKYKDNTLIQALLAENYPEPEQSSATDFPSYDEALSAVKAAGEIAERTASGKEAQGYKQFIIDLTDHVANAAGEGFMGSGNKVSQAEIDYINTLKATLGIS